MRGRQGVKTAERLPVEMLQAFERIERLTAAKALPPSRTAREHTPKQRLEPARAKRIERMMVSAAIAFTVFVAVIAFSGTSVGASTKSYSARTSRASMGLGKKPSGCASGSAADDTSWFGITNGQRSQFTLRCPGR